MSKMQDKYQVLRGDTDRLFSGRGHFLLVLRVLIYHAIIGIRSRYPHSLN